MTRTILGVIYKGGAEIFYNIMTSSLRNWVMECNIEPITALTARLETSPNFYWSVTIGFGAFVS